MSNDSYIIIIFLIAFSLAFLAIYSLSGSSRKNKLHHNIWANREKVSSPYFNFYKEVLHSDLDSHYLNTFLSLDGSITYKRSWNWPASAFTVLWLIYRGMLGTAAAIASIILAAIFMAPIPITVSILIIVSLLLGAFGSRYYHFLVRRDIDILLAADTPSQVMTQILHKNWDSRISIADIGITTAAILLGGMAYIYEFNTSGLASKIKKLGSTLPAISPPDLSSHLQIEAKYSLEDIKNIFRQALHKESVAALLMSKVKAETRSAKQKEIFIVINAAATEGNPLTQFAMGMIYRHGYLNVFKDVNLAIYWYKQSANHGNVDAKVELGKLYLLDDPTINNPRESQTWLKQAADEGSTVARDMLKEQLEKKLNARPTDKTAARLISQSGKGDTEARLALLKTIREERDTKKQKALVSGLVEAATENNASAGYLLGLAYQNGYLGLTRNTVSAISWYKHSALHGSLEAQLELGKLYLIGDPDIRNPAEAEFWLKQAADQGATIARDMLRLQEHKSAEFGQKYQSLDGLISRADHGNSDAKLSLLETIAGEADPQLQKSLLIHLTDAATANNALAAYLLGVIHQNGHLGLPKNTASAMSWYKESAMNGNVDAQLELGRQYRLNGADRTTPAEAEFWLKQAANQGSAMARDMLNRPSQDGDSINLKPNPE